MNTNQHPDDFPEIQAAIYRVALSLDSFILNGIPYGVIHRDWLDGFLEKTANILLTELASLEAQAAQAPSSCQRKVIETLAVLRSKCQQLIDLATGLISFRSLSLEQLRTTVSQIPLLREACVQQIQELERCFQVPKPFYQSRPMHSTAGVNNFLADLENIFIQERNASIRQNV